MEKTIYFSTRPHELWVIGYTVDGQEVWARDTLDWPLPELEPEEFWRIIVILAKMMLDHLMQMGFVPTIQSLVWEVKSPMPYPIEEI